MKLFTLKEQKAFEHMILLQAMLGEIQFFDTNCPALANQLNEAKVLTEKLFDKIRVLQGSIKAPD